MLAEICATLKNWFEPHDGYGRHFGVFTIENGQLAPLDFLQNGQYFRIVGSAFNEGVYRYQDAKLIDEVFDGAVWEMRPPPAFLSLAAEIEAYAVSDAAKPSPFVSESFGGYAYEKATDANGAPVSWQSAFAKRLNQWRKV